MFHVIILFTCAQAVKCFSCFQVIRDREEEGIAQKLYAMFTGTGSDPNWHQKTH